MCWFGQTLHVLKAALDEAHFNQDRNFPSPFHQRISELLAISNRVVIDPRPILDEFMDYFVEEDDGIQFNDTIQERIIKRRAAKQRLDAAKQDLRTRQQHGETGLDLLRSCRYFDSIKIRTRQKIERVNCRIGCIDLDDNVNPNKYDIPLTYSQPKSMVVYPVPMPTRGRTLESTFLYTFDRVDIYNKKCRNCNDGIKKQTTKLELTSMPHSIIIGLNRGIPNANGVTIDKDETKVNLEKEFYLELPNGDRKKFSLVATSQHTGKFRICVNVSVFLKLVLQIPYMRVWLISTFLILHFHQET